MVTMKIVNEIYEGADGRQSLFDITIPENWNNRLIIFIHGFMGYKDWGCWNLVEDYFTERQYGFLKFNMSHNGGTTTDPIDFSDPEAFSKNTYTKELQDLEIIIEIAKKKCGDSVQLFLIGHSRGGGIALLESTRDDIKAIAAWAAISDIGRRFPKGEALEIWKSEGVRYQSNSRTKQNLPILHDQYTDFIKNSDRLNIEYYCEHSNTPTVVIHGENDTSVPLSEGKEIAGWLGKEVQVIKNTQHTFGSSQPWNDDDLPDPLKIVCDITCTFFKTIEL